MTASLWALLILGGATVELRSGHSGVNGIALGGI
jgi:hypothetical protein